MTDIDDSVKKMKNTQQDAEAKAETTKDSCGRKTKFRNIEQGKK